MNLVAFDGFEIVRVEGEPEEPFQAGSISKPVAALLALRLVGAGVLDLDEDVNERLASWELPQGDGVTLRRLLGHTAGLGVSFFPGYESGTALPSLEQILDGEPPANTAPVRLEATPGSGFRYSGGGYVLLQLLLEEVTGTPFAELAAEHVLGPLGMASTTFSPRSGPGHVYPEEAAAGLWTTAADLARFVLALQRRVDGTPPMLEAHVELPQDGEWTVLRELGMEPPTRFGLGLFLTDVWFSHLGGAYGSFSALFGSLEAGRGIVAAAAGEATPAFFERLAAIANGLSWVGFGPSRGNS